jgi:hypothetical protein
MIEAYIKAQEGILKLQEAVLLCVREKDGLNTKQVGELLGIDDFGEVKGQGFVQRAILFSLANTGKIRTDQKSEGAEHHWHINGG